MHEVDDADPVMLFGAADLMKIATLEKAVADLTIREAQQRAKLEAIATQLAKMEYFRADSRF
jgi:hypothetical protein